MLEGYSLLFKPLNLTDTNYFIAAAFKTEPQLVQLQT